MPLHGDMSEGLCSWRERVVWCVSIGIAGLPNFGGGGGGGKEAPAIIKEGILYSILWYVLERDYMKCKSSGLLIL